MTAADARRQELKIVLLIAAVQFVNILDFMMVMPLGPDLAAALGFSSDKIGVVGGAYTASACIVALAAARFLDRFDRRRALIWALFGLVVATALGGLAWDLESLLVARVLAGAFGGPATAMALAVIADVVPPERRGRAMGMTGGAFAMASVLGVPMGLFLAELWGWRMPFFVVAGMGAAVLVGVGRWLPSLTRHLATGYAPAPLLTLLRRRAYWAAFAVNAAAMAHMFLLVPYIAPHLMQNLGFPRGEMEFLYMIGGAVSFVGMQGAGRLVDRFGAMPVAFAMTMFLTSAIAFGFADLAPTLALSAYAIFPAFMFFATARFVAVQSLASKVPAPQERAGFMSLMSAVQHAASSGGAVAGSFILHDLPDGRLGGMPTAAALSIVLAAAVPALMIGVERRVRRQEAAIAGAPAPAEAV